MHSDRCWSDDYCAVYVEADGDGERRRIVVTGDLDAFTLPQLSRLLAEHPLRTVELDLNGVTFASVATARLVSSLRADGALIVGTSSALNRTISLLEELARDQREVSTPSPVASHGPSDSALSDLGGR